MKKFSATVACLALCALPALGVITTARLDALRNQTREMFYHAYDNYLLLAYPKDELDPLRCVGKGPDLTKRISTENDVMGNYLTTLIDSLDTTIIMNDVDRFQEGIKLITNYIKSFHINVRVQVFEVNIRILGGLLSCHQYAERLNHTGQLELKYDGKLLELAYDLGKRLLPAFETSTGIPFPRVNLQKGVLFDERLETCTAAAGTLLLEFGLLSQLTNDDRFKIVAARSMHAIWKRRLSKSNLIGNEINIMTGEWTSAATSIGAGVDSFYEYMFKSYVVFNHTVPYNTFLRAYGSIVHHILDEHIEMLYLNVDLYSNGLYTTWIDSLSAYISGLQVQFGDIRRAIKSHMIYWKIWQKYRALPERWDFRTREPSIRSYLLRPELIESTYFLYQATQDHFYLEVGATILNDINTLTRTRCGFAQLVDVYTGEKGARMESFFLSETLKYLYLLFTPNHSLNRDEYVMFTTEGHPLWLRKDALYRENGNVKLNKTRPYKSKIIGDEVWMIHQQCPRFISSPLTAISVQNDVRIAESIVGKREIVGMKKVKDKESQKKVK